MIMAGEWGFPEPELTGVSPEFGKMGLRRAIGGGGGKIEGLGSFASSRRSFWARWWSGGDSGVSWRRWWGECGAPAGRRAFYSRGQGPLGSARGWIRMPVARAIDLMMKKGRKSVWDPGVVLAGDGHAAATSGSSGGRGWRSALARADAE